MAGQAAVQIPGLSDIDDLQVLHEEIDTGHIDGRTFAQLITDHREREGNRRGGGLEHDRTERESRPMTSDCEVSGDVAFQGRRMEQRFSSIDAEVGQDVRVGELTYPTRGHSNHLCNLICRFQTVEIQLWGIDCSAHLM